MLSLAEAWQWIQVGFCAAAGASVIIAPLMAVRVGSAPAEDDPAPHCSRCCPNPDDDHDVD